MKMIEGQLLMPGNFCMLLFKIKGEGGDGGSLNGINFQSAATGINF